MPPELTSSQFARAATNLQAVKMYSLASTVMLWYDLMLTFSDEVEKIWKQPWSFATILWVMNRYIPGLGFIVLQCSFLMRWPEDVCDHFVIYAEAVRLVMTTTVSVIFILRIYAIYGRQRGVLIAMTLLLLFCIALKIWAFTDGTRLQLPPGLSGCILTSAHSPSGRFAFTWVADLIFDTVVFVVTLSRTLSLYRRNRNGPATPLVACLIRDGILYFAVIFVSNFVTVMTFILAPPDLKAVNASFGVLITSLMVSRLILNLRGANSKIGPRVYGRGRESTMIPAKFKDRMIGILGNTVKPSWDPSLQTNSTGNPEA